MRTGKKWILSKTEKIWNYFNFLSEKRIENFFTWRIENFRERKWWKMLNKMFAFCFVFSTFLHTSMRQSIFFLSWILPSNKSEGHYSLYSILYGNYFYCLNHKKNYKTPSNNSFERSYPSNLRFQCISGIIPTNQNVRWDVFYEILILSVVKAQIKIFYSKLWFVNR